MEKDKRCADSKLKRAMGKETVKTARGKRREYWTRDLVELWAVLLFRG